MLYFEVGLNQRHTIQLAKGIWLHDKFLLIKLSLIRITPLFRYRINILILRVLAVAPESSEARVRRSVHDGAHVDAPQPRQVPLHHHVVLQEHHPPQHREHLQEVEPEVVQQRHVVTNQTRNADRYMGAVTTWKTWREGSARRGGLHDGDGEHVVGEDGVVVERRVGELRRRDGRVVGDGRGVGEAGLEEAHGEAVERLRFWRGPRVDAGIEHTRAPGAEEPLPHGEDGVGELLDIGLRVECLLGSAGEGARA